MKISKYLCLLLLLTTYNVSAKTINAVASFSITADITSQVVGNRANVSSIVDKNIDPHSYNLKPQDLIKLEKADLIIINGRGLEGFLTRLSNDESINDKLIIASTGIKERIFSDGDENGNIDPHVWQNPLNVIKYAENIRDGFCKIDPEGCDYYTKNTKDLTAKLTAIDTEYALKFAKVPTNNKVLITTHDAFGYLADRYGLKILAPLSMNNESEPKAQVVSEISKMISDHKINIIFIENLSNNNIIEELAKDGHSVINGTLYSDSLSNDDVCAKNYIDMIKCNLSRIYAAMTSKQ